MANEAFKLVPTPEGGMSLHLNLAKTSFVVAMTPEEVKGVMKKVEAWHKKMHASASVSGRGLPDPVLVGRREVMGTLMRRMAEVTPPGLMGQAAASTIDARGTANVNVSPGLMDLIQSGQKAYGAIKNAQTVSRQSKARSAAQRKQDPTLRQYAGQMLRKAGRGIKAAIPKVRLTATARVNVPFRPEPSKRTAVTNGLATIRLRRARFLAWQRRPGSQPTRQDMMQANQWTNGFAIKNGIPSTTTKHQFWNYPLPIIQTKVSATVKLAEAQGAPAAPPKGVPVRPAWAAIDNVKIGIVRRGLRILAGRRARFIAKQRNATVTSPLDINQGKNYARSVFISKGVPTSYPVAGRGAIQIAGWTFPKLPPGGGLRGMPPGAATGPSFEARRGIAHFNPAAGGQDAVTAFWAQSASVIKQKIDDILRLEEPNAPSVLPGAPVVMPPAPGTAAAPASASATSNYQYGGGGGGGGGGGYGGGGGGGGDGGLAPGDMSQPMSDLPEEAPGNLATADEPGMDNYPAGQSDRDYDQLRADGSIPPEGEIPGSLDPIETPGDFQQMEEQPGLDEVTEADVDASQAVTDYQAQADDAPDGGDIEPADDEPQLEPGEGEMNGEFELDGVGHHKRRGGSKTISKKRYEHMVKHCAKKIAAKAGKSQPTPADFAAAKITIDRNLRSRGVTVVGDALLGLSDIMGAAYIIGAAERGSPVAKAAIKKSLIAAKKGKPKAKKFVRALTVVARGKQSVAAKKKGGIFSRYFRAVHSLGTRA